MRDLELLSPAATADTAIQAILHGADAVYIGPPSHGARKGASNSIEDIERVADFAHRYRAKVYATVNTLVYDNEIRKVETLCQDLYKAGVDAIIVQDMALLRMQLPPIALHASTQCDIRTPEKARFLEQVGFSQLVLARELTLKEIREITEAVTIPVETFIHGALCVCYSGRCHASLALTGRSANRGECAQICRYPFTLTDANGKSIAPKRHYLSLKDFNASHNLEELVKAGVSSFKIEGRLKDTGYVKNVTAFYSQQLNNIISQSPDNYRRSSFGDVELKFNPKLDKSFNRGFTNYFLTDRQPPKIASLLTPKSQGEIIPDVSVLNNGDGISFYDWEGNFTGVNINGVRGSHIIPARKIDIPSGTIIYRTSDIKWDKLLEGETAKRRIPIDITLESDKIAAIDEMGLRVALPLEIPFEKANKTPDYRSVFEKLGNTPYVLRNFTDNLDPERFYRVSEMTEMRRKLIRLLEEFNKETYTRDLRRPENLDAQYSQKELDYRDNVANHLVEEFYIRHGVTKIERSAETDKKLYEGDTLMTTRHCILREIGMCRKEKGNAEKLRFPLYLDYDKGRLRLDFDCKNCEMKVML